MGFPGADEASLARLEARIGRRLPPSYRAFLELTDGWRHAGAFVRRVAGTAEAAPLDEAEADRYASYEDYLWAGEDSTEEMVHRSRVWHRALRIDAEADAGILVLDPGDVGPDGEWAVYSSHSWKAAPAERFDSFRAFMDDKYREFHHLAVRDGMVNDTTRSLDAAVEFAREEALTGRWERAANVLARAAQFGRPGSHGQQPAEVRELAQQIHDGTFAYEPAGPFADAVRRARESARWGDCDGAWRVLRAGLPYWIPPAEDLLAPVGLLADPLLAPVITPERGRELLGTPRAGRTGMVPDPTPDLDPAGLAWLASETWGFGHGCRFVLVEGVRPAHLVDLLGADGEGHRGLAAPTTMRERYDPRRESRQRRSGNPWGDHPVMAVGRAGPDWSFAFAPASGHPDPDRLRSPAAWASRSAPESRAVVVWCIPGARRDDVASWHPSALHLSVARGGETEYALTVTVPSASAASENPQSRIPVVHRVGTVPDAFALDPVLTEPAAVAMRERDWRPHQEGFLRAVAEEFGVALPRHALVQGRLHSLETVDWSRAPREGDRWLSIRPA